MRLTHALHAPSVPRAAPSVPSRPRLSLERPMCSLYVPSVPRATPSVPFCGRTWYKSLMPRIDRVLLHVVGQRRRVVDPEDVYYLEAAGDETVVRQRRRRTIRDVRSLGEVQPFFEPFLVYRVHEKWAVNLRRIREILPQRDGRDWEVVMDPPVNRVIPVSRRRLGGLPRFFAGTGRSVRG